MISVPFCFVWLIDWKQKQKETSDLLDAINKNILPLLNDNLKQLKTKLKRKGNLDDEIRISLWIPVRLKFLSWHLKMICRTDNIPDRETEAYFDLNEGVIGYLFCKSNAREKYKVEFINLTNPQNLPQSYKDLKQDNKTLIKHNIVGVLGIVSLQSHSIVGLLAIDTDQTNNLSKMEGKDLHDIALEWIIDNSGVVKLLWRMKNNV